MTLQTRELVYNADVAGVNIRAWKMPNGTHKITARCKDSKGKTFTSSVISNSDDPTQAVFTARQEAVDMRRICGTNTKELI